MAYVKLQKAIQNTALGFQTVNVAIANNDAERTLYAVEHDIPYFNTNPAGFSVITGKKPGAHSAPGIPRSVGVVTVTSTQYGTGSPTIAATLGLKSGSTQYVARLSTGVYVIATEAQGAAFCTVHPVDTSTGVKLATARPVVAGMPVHGWVVSLYTLSAGDFIAADFSFHFSVYAE